MNTEQLITFIKEEIALAIDQPIAGIEDNVHFLRLGISSIQTMKVMNKIKKKLVIDLNPIAMFEHKTINELARYLQSCLVE
jgi:acyl carrier protein